MATRRLIVEVVGDSASLERSFRRSSTAAGSFSRDLSRSGRGVAALSVGYRSLARSVAFAGAEFAGAVGIGVVIQKSIQGAEQLAKAQQSLRVALEHTGESVVALTPKYNSVALASVKFGVSQVTALTGLARATALTGDSTEAFRAYGEALNISKATGKDFNAVLTATAKGQEGVVGSLQRFGIEVKKGTSGAAQYAAIMARFGGQAAANTTNLDRLRASASNLATQLGGPALAALDKAAGAVSGFVQKLSEAHGVHAKLDVTFDGVKGLGAKLIDVYKAEFRLARAGIEKGLAELTNINWKPALTKAGQDAGRAVVASLNFLTTAIRSVDWNHVGQSIVRGLELAIGAAVTFLRGVDWGKVARVTVRLLADVFKAQSSFLAGIGEALGKALLEGIGKGLDAVGSSLEKKAIKIVLGIIDPLTSIPGWLGPEGGWARSLKTSLHATLDSLNAPAAADGQSIGQSITQGITAGVAAAQAQLQALLAGSQTKPIGSRNATAGFASVTGLGATGAGAGGGAQAVVDNSFTLPLRLQLEQAKADADGSQKEILQGARDVAAFIRSQLGKLHGAKLVDAYGQLASANTTIRDAVQAAAQKAKDAAAAAKSFSVPLALQVREARLQALGEPITSVLKQIRDTATRALRSGKLGLQGQLDAWNAIADVNSQLNQQVSQLGFKQLNTAKIAKSLGLSGDALRRFRAIESQIGKGGTVPTKGVGAFGVAAAAGGGGATVVLHHETKLDSKVLGRSTTVYRQKHNRRNPTQRRGPNAGG